MQQAFHIRVYFSRSKTKFCCCSWTDQEVVWTKGIFPKSVHALCSRQTAFVTHKTLLHFSLFFSTNEQFSLQNSFVDMFLTLTAQFLELPLRESMYWEVKSTSTWHQVSLCRGMTVPVQSATRMLFPALVQGCYFI